jgi:hypothetical protein
MNVHHYVLISTVAHIAICSHGFSLPPPTRRHHAASQAVREPSLSPIFRHHRRQDDVVLVPSHYSRPTTARYHNCKHQSNNRRRIIAFSSTSTSSDESSTPATESLPKIDRILSQLTCLFPLFVLGSAVLGSFVPHTLNWVNNGNLMTNMLAG